MSKAVEPPNIDDEVEIELIGPDEKPEKWTRLTKPLDNEEKSLIIDLYFKKKKTPQEIAYIMGRTNGTIYKFIKKFMSTDTMAEQFFRSRSMEMAKKVVAKADVNQLIDVLSRPNIGVLKPVSKGHDGPQIMISVNQESIGSISNGSAPNSMPSPTNNVKLLVGGVNATRTGREVSDGEESCTTGLQGETGSRGQEHEVRSDPYPSRVQAGPGKKAGPEASGERDRTQRHHARIKVRPGGREIIEQFRNWVPSNKATK